MKRAEIHQTQAGKLGPDFTDVSILQLLPSSLGIVLLHKKTLMRHL